MIYYRLRSQGLGSGPLRSENLVFCVCVVKPTKCLRRRGIPESAETRFLQQSPFRFACPTHHQRFFFFGYFISCGENNTFFSMLVLSGCLPHSGGKKQHKHKLFGPNFLRTFLTHTPGCPAFNNFFPISGAAGSTHFSERTSTIFGAHAHNPKGSRKILSRKSLR